MVLTWGMPTSSAIARPRYSRWKCTISNCPDRSRLVSGTGKVKSGQDSCKLTDGCRQARHQSDGGLGITGRKQRYILAHCYQLFSEIRDRSSDPTVGTRRHALIQRCNLRDFHGLFTVYSAASSSNNLPSAIATGSPATVTLSSVNASAG